MAPRRRPPSQGWRTFLLIMRRDCLDRPVRGSDDLISAAIRIARSRHGRRRIMWIGVTAHPTAEWIARQITEACGWEEVPTYLVRDRDCVYGGGIYRRTRAMGIRDRPTAPRSPWQNGYRTTHRLDQTRMPGSRDHNWRATSAPYPAFVPAILQRHPNAPVIGQGLTANQIRPGGRPHSSAADPRRIAPSLRPELIFDRHSQLQVGSCHCEAPDATLVVQIEAPSLARRSEGLPSPRRKFIRQATLFSSKSRPH